MSATLKNTGKNHSSIFERAGMYSKWLNSLPIRDRVAHLLMKWDYMCFSQEHSDSLAALRFPAPPVGQQTSQEQYEVLERLATRESALAAWKKLHSMTIKRDGWCFDSVVSFVGRDAAFCRLPIASKRTASEIKSAGEKAAKLAVELAELIEGHSTLQFSGWRIAPPDMKDESVKQFSEYGHLGMIFRLRAFAELASLSAATKPVVPRPSQSSADAHALAVDLCIRFEDIYGTPCIDAAAALVSEAFDRLIDADTVKKWWQRRAIEEDHGDTSEEFS